MSSTSNTQAPAVVEVKAADVQDNGSVFCPNPKMALWSTHPKVFIDLTHGGQGKCPYCGTLYKLAAGEHLHSAH
nr:zinc-finger domain-containing protein [Pelomonas sp. KK5]